MLSRGSDENPSGMDAISPILHGGRDMESQALLATSEIPSSPGQGPLGRPGRPRRRCNARVAEGAVLLFLVNIIWVASSEVVQYIYNDLDFNKPFFLTYVSNSLFMLLFPMQCGVEKLRQRGVCVPAQSPSSPLPAPLRQTAKIAAIISPMWFLAQGSYNWSLNSTSVASSTILSTTSCLFTLLFSACFLKEKVTILKLLGVAVTIGGAVCVAFNDNNSGTDHLYGDAICLFSAVMYGVYTTAIRWYIPDESSVKMAYFFGFLGGFNAAALLPLVLVLHYAGIENLTALTAKIFFFIVMKGLFDNVLSDMLWARSIMLTSPTVATVGLSLTIPLSLFADWIVKHETPHALLWVGSFMVLLGFGAVSLDVPTAMVVSPQTVAVGSDRMDGADMELIGASPSQAGTSGSMDVPAGSRKRRVERAGSPAYDPDD